MKRPANEEARSKLASGMRKEPPSPELSSSSAAVTGLVRQMGKRAPRHSLISLSFATGLQIRISRLYR